MRTLTILFMLNFAILAQWNEVKNGLPDSWESNSAIDVVDENIAVVALYKYPATRLFLTTNAGNLWTELPSPEDITNLHVNDIEIHDINNIWICTGETDPNRGRIYYTSDMGISWTKQYDNKTASTYLNYIEMFDELNGVAMGDPPFDDLTQPALFLRTFNGGITWEKMNNDYLIGAFSESRWQSVQFLSTVTGFFVPSHTSATSNKIYHTTDSGVTWSELFTSGYSSFSLLKFYDSNYGFASGQSNDTTFYYRTTDGGNNWQHTIITDSEEPVDVEFLPSDSQKLWKTDQNSLRYSETGGLAWHDFTPSITFSGIDIEISDNNTGWVLGKNAVYYATLTSPTVGLVETETTPEEFSLNQNYPNPFNPSTNISFSLPERSNVKLAVYDIIGTEIAVLVNRELTGGSYEYSFNAGKYNLASGIYLYRLATDSKTTVKKMTYIK